MAEKSQKDRPIKLGELTLDDGHRISCTSIGDETSPLLLFIVGSSGLGYLYHRIAIELSSTFRCVYYDKRAFLPRGMDYQIATNQKNPLVLVERHSDDAAALIRHLSPHQSVYVFGTSTGGTAALDLTVRYPQLVRLAILHEPMTFSVMRDTKLKDEMIALYQTMGEMKDSVKSFAIFTEYMFKSPDRDLVEATVYRRPSESSNAVEMYNGRQGQREATAMVKYVVDESRARTMSDRIVVICGKESTAQPVCEPGKALARILGDDRIRELPGDHMSFATKKHAAAFAEKLLLILREKRPNARPMARI